MNSTDKKNLTKAMHLNSRNQVGVKPISPISEPIEQDIRVVKEAKASSYVRQDSSKKYQETVVTSERLQDAVIWSEILAKPVCKRRKRRTLWE